MIKPTICYAVKANFNKNILSLMSKLNLGADVVSQGELQNSLKSGINKKKLFFLELEKLVKK